MSEQIRWFIYPNYIENIRGQIEEEILANEEADYPLSCVELFDIVMIGIRHHFEDAGRDLEEVTLAEIMRDYEGEEVSRRAFEIHCKEDEHEDEVIIL